MVDHDRGKDLLDPLGTDSLGASHPLPANQCAVKQGKVTSEGIGESDGVGSAVYQNEAPGGRLDQDCFASPTLSTFICSRPSGRWVANCKVRPVVTANTAKVNPAGKLTCLDTAISSLGR